MEGPQTPSRRSPERVFLVQGCLDIVSTSCDGSGHGSFSGRDSPMLGGGPGCEAKGEVPKHAKTIH